MALEDQTLSRLIFCERANIILGRGQVENEDSEFSVVHDLLKTASLFKVAVNVSRGEQTFPQIMADFSLFVH